MLDSLTSMSFGYNLICTVMTVTSLAILCLPFTIASISERIGIAIHLFISGAGLAFGLVYLYDFTFYNQQILGYCICCGLASLICSYLLRPFHIAIPMFIIGVTGGCAGLIGGIIGLFVGGAIACPYLWFSGIFWVLAHLYIRIRIGNIFTKVICTILGGGTLISLSNTVINSTTINIFAPIINNYIIKYIINSNNNVTRAGDRLAKSHLIITGDYGSKTISKTSIVGSSSVLPEITSRADECSAMQFLVATDVETDGYQYSGQQDNNYKVNWTIRSCNTGDSSTETYIRSGYGEYTKLTQTPVTINSHVSLEIRKEDETITSLQITQRPGNAYSQY